MKRYLNRTRVGYNVSQKKSSCFHLASKLESIYFFKVYRFIWITQIGSKYNHTKKKGEF